MKKRALRKEFFMEIRKSLPRFLSILFIVALGTAFYSGIQSSSPDMRYSGDAYFDAKELSDIQVTGTMGVTGDDVEALQNLKDIETAEGVCLKDVLTGEEGQRKVLRILSIPEKSNLVTVEEGEYPTKEDECLMDVQYAEHNGYQIGDTFRISEELEKDEDATLKSDTFTITGLCSSPLYISFSRGSTNVGNGEIAGFVYVPQETFTTDYYMQIYLKVKGAKELTAYTDAYDTTVAQAKEQVESIEKERCTRRQEEIKDEAQEKVSDARKELADKKAEADQKLTEEKHLAAMLLHALYNKQYLLLSWKDNNALRCDDPKLLHRKVRQLRILSGNDEKHCRDRISDNKEKSVRSYTWESSFPVRASFLQKNGQDDESDPDADLFSGAEPYQTSISLENRGLLPFLLWAYHCT